MDKNENNKKTSELRQNLVTGDWVVVALNRSMRPDDFSQKESDIEHPIGVQECLFCDPVASKQEQDVLLYGTGETDWSLRVFPNKFPAFSRLNGGKVMHKDNGPYFWMESIGYHEVIVTRDHNKPIGKMEPIMVAEILDAYQSRYIDLMNKKSVNYIDIFHNHGKSAGASIAHPHSQLIAIPVVSAYVKAELEGAEKYHQMNKQCVYCAILEWENEERKRIVWENDEFIIFCPYAPRVNFEMLMMPKKHKPYFERITEAEKIAGGEALQKALAKLDKLLNNPDYNFFIHTSPCDGRDYPHFHWHIEILPKTNIWAGFEISTGIEITTINPEEAAKYLREA